MKATEHDPKRLYILAGRNALQAGDPLPEWLASWRKKLGYFSVFAALPAIFASHPTEARADDVRLPQPEVAGPNARFADRPNKSCGSKPDFLKRLSEYRLPHQRGSIDVLRFLGGNDDCPGRAIPAGTYTAAAPYADTGNTTGANDSVSGIYSYYCYCNLGTPGPDQVYTFRVTATGPNPQIQVTATSTGYDPAIYLLYDQGYSGECPTGTNQIGYNHMYWLYNPTSGGSETIQLNLGSYFLGMPLHLYVDSTLSGANNSGGYVLRIQDVTISPVLLSRPAFDFDGDGRSDISVFRPSDGTWYLDRSLQGYSASRFGISTDKILPIHLKGDRKTDLAVFRDGAWWLRDNYGLDAYYDRPVIQFGLPNDIPVPADYNGDGYDELAVYRNGAWWMLNIHTDQTNYVEFGLAGDKPVPADYDGDGRVDLAVFRPSDRNWYILRSSDSHVSITNWGLSTDKLIPADYDGDGKTDVAVYRDGTWYVLGSQIGFSALQFGLASDIPVPADYDGDGKTDAAVYRDGIWYLLQSTNGFTIQRFGTPGDQPLPGAFVR